jgi:hypothetical protein
VWVSNEEDATNPCEGSSEVTPKKAAGTAAEADRAIDELGAMKDFAVFAPVAKV